MTLNTSTILLVSILLSFSSKTFAQKLSLASGPMYGHYTKKSKEFWLLIKQGKSKSSVQKKILLSEQVGSFVDSVFNSVEGQRYAGIQQIHECNYLSKQLILVRGKIALHSPEPTKDSLAFLVGSCAFPYPFGFWSGKKRERIFDSMSKEKTDFMIWMGDNVYYLFKQWNNPKKMLRINLKARLKKSLKGFLEHCPQYALWDDHDFGPNNSNSSFEHKDISLAIFKQFWANPYYGTDSCKGVFSHFSHQNTSFFLLDTRYQNTGKYMLGKKQLAWLKTQLKNSKDQFKFVISPTQVLPVNEWGEDMQDYPKEKKKLLDFIQKEKIEGVIFISGDRHYAELSIAKKKLPYPLYELTSSPLTSMPNPKPTENQKLRVDNTLFKDQNYAKVIIRNINGEATCTLRLLNKDGRKIWEYFIKYSDLKCPK